MKRRDLERHLRAEGCRQIDEGANHARWAGPGGTRSVVPRHREIDFGLARWLVNRLPPTGDLPTRSGRRIVEQRVEVEVRDVDRARHELREEHLA